MDLHTTQRAYRLRCADKVGETTTMKRTLVIATMCMLLLATVGATVAVAKEKAPAGSSDVYQYDIQLDPTGTGKLVVNVKQQTFVFNAKGCTPGTTYYLYYTTASTGRVDLGWATADAYGRVSMQGPCAATPAELRTADGTTAPIRTGISVDLTSNAVEPVKPGDTITYTATITNTGDVTLTGITATVDPEKFGPATLSATTLAAGAGSVTGTFSYTVTQADIDTGLTVTVNVAGTPPSGSAVTGSDTLTVTVTAPKIRPQFTVHYATWEYDRTTGIITSLEQAGYLVEPTTSKGIAGATIHVYLKGTTTPVTPDGSTVPVTVTTDERGLWDTTLLPIAKYGWTSNVWDFADFYFAGDDTHTDAWAVMGYPTPLPP